mmetsp:Transcript_14455/g.33638  ORF Transcript_14455/g.33638 Transcript_14455/m.33638 type:complete len:124 (+) Transcript_14455:3715-4086(+)
MYHGGSSQFKEPWDFAMEGFDTKLDRNPQDKPSNTVKKLVAYGRRARTTVATGNVEDSGSQSFEDSKLDNKNEQSKSEEKLQVSEEELDSHGPQGRSKLQERTISPFTRNVSRKNDIDTTEGK